MPALNFQKQFADKVRTGEKLQTIRKPRANPIREGDTLYLYTGMRTKNCEKLGEGVCYGVKDVEILENGVMIINGMFLNKSLRNEIANRDGFDTYTDMWLWFKNTHGLPFKGQLILWDKGEIDGTN